MVGVGSKAGSSGKLQRDVRPKKSNTLLAGCVCGEERCTYIHTCIHIHTHIPYMETLL